MGRFLAPLLAFAASAFVFYKNQGATAEFVFLFPMNLLFEDPVVAGQRSWQALAAVGLLWLVTDTVSFVRSRRAAAAETAKQG